MIHKLMPEERAAVVKRIDEITALLQAEKSSVVESSTLAREQTMLRQVFVTSELNRDAHVADGRRIAHLKEIAKDGGEQPAFSYFARIIERCDCVGADSSDGLLSESDQTRIDRFLAERGVASTHLTLAELYAVLGRLGAIDAELNASSPPEQNADQIVTATALNHERTALRAQLVNDSREPSNTGLPALCRRQNSDHIDGS